uniref:Uncharacterized protein n=1 Tax=Salix viminalis TaxID=40686 RepID=A0A6N2LFH6_SALVM
MPSFELTDPIASHVQQLSTDNCSSWSPASSSDASATFWVSHTQKLAPFSSFPSNQVLYDKSCGLNLLKSVNMTTAVHHLNRVIVATLSLSLISNLAH